MKKRHLLHRRIAGFTYYEGPVVFEELKIGTLLSLKRESDNRFDNYAVAIYYGESKLRFIPKDHNHDISKFLEQGHDIFETRIQRVSSEENPENQIQVIIYILQAIQPGEKLTAG